MEFKGGEQSANILRERELTCSWVVVVPATIYFVAFANRAEGAASAGQAYAFLCLCIFLIHFCYVGMALSSQLTLSVDVVNILLLNIYLLHLVCMTRICRGLKEKNIKGNLTYRYMRKYIIMDESKILTIKFSGQGAISRKIL